jgi:hypothetical protein
MILKSILNKMNSKAFEIDLLQKIGIVIYRRYFNLMTVYSASLPGSI